MDPPRRGVRGDHSPNKIKIHGRKKLDKYACNNHIAGNDNSASMRRKAVMKICNKCKEDWMDCWCSPETLDEWKDYPEEQKQTIRDLEKAFSTLEKYLIGKEIEK